METIKKFIGFALGVFLVFASWVAVELALLVDDARKVVNNNALDLTTTVNNLKLASSKLPSTTQDLSIIASKGKNFTNVVATEERAKEVANYLDVLNFNSQVAQNDIRQAIAESKQTSIMLRKQAEPILVSANELVKEGTATVAELKHQIKQNGDGINSIITATEPELVAMLKELRKTTEKITILTNDENIPKIVTNLEKSTKELGQTTANIEVVTGQVAALSVKAIDPIVNPPKQTGIKKVLVPAYQIFKSVTALGQILLVIERLNR